MHGLRCRLLVGAALTCLIPAAALASRAELDGRGLPRLLAFDSSLIRVLPGSASRLDPRLDVDVTGTSSGYFIDDSGNLVYYDGSNADTFVLGLGGRSTHVGYLLDGNRHNLVLAGPAGWGLVLGYERATSHSDQYEITVRADTVYSSSHTASRSTSETLRLAAGWQGWTSGGRLYEIGLGAGPHHKATDYDYVSVSGNETTDDHEHWEGHRGFTVDATVRTLSRNPGPQIAAEAIYENPNPRPVAGFHVENWRLTGYLQTGWRVPTSRLDDLVVGTTASLSRSFDDLPETADSVAFVNRRNSTTVSPRLFVSGEKALAKGLLARGGIQAGGTYSLNVTQSAYIHYDGSVSYTTYRSGSWAFGSPSFYLGAGWRWKTIALDGVISNTLNLDRPVVRWSARVLL